LQSADIFKPADADMSFKVTGPEVAPAPTFFASELLAKLGLVCRLACVFERLSGVGLMP